MAKKEKYVHEHVHYEKHMEVKKVGVLFILAWLFGILFILAGAMNFDKSVFGAILIILGGIIILPPFGEFIQKKFNFQLTGWLKFIVFLVLVGVGISLTTTPGGNIEPGTAEIIESQSVEPVKIEEKIVPLPTKKETGMIATVNSAEKQQIIGECGEFVWKCDKAETGKTFLIIDVTVENKGVTGGFMGNYISSSEFKIKDDDGYVYGSAYTSSLDQEFPSGEIPEGDKVRGKIAFEIPTGAKGLKLTFKDSSISLQ